VDFRYVGATAVSSADCCFGVAQWRRCVVYRLEWNGGTTPPYLPQTPCYGKYTCLTVTNWIETASTMSSTYLFRSHVKELPTDRMKNVSNITEEKHFNTHKNSQKYFLTSNILFRPILYAHGILTLHLNSLSLTTAVVVRANEPKKRKWV